jgi:hypothetical protein
MMRGVLGSAGLTAVAGTKGARAWQVYHPDGDVIA